MNDKHANHNEKKIAQQEEAHSVCVKCKLHSLFLCLCSFPNPLSRFMIACDKCSEWYHGDCVGIGKMRGRQMEKAGTEWICPVCTGKM